MYELCESNGEEERIAFYPPVLLRYNVVIYMPGLCSAIYANMQFNYAYIQRLSDQIRQAGAVICSMIFGYIV